jgi:hypothetical protein
MNPRTLQAIAFALGCVIALQSASPAFAQNAAPGANTDPQRPVASTPATTTSPASQAPLRDTDREFASRLNSLERLSLPCVLQASTHSGAPTSRRKSVCPTRSNRVAACSCRPAGS